MSDQVRRKRSTLRRFAGCLVIIIGLAFAVQMILRFFTEGHTWGERKIAVIEVTGLIADSKSFNDQLAKYVEDDHIAAIILRINSPGGVIAPSQEMYQEILKAREQKKIFVSMGTVAASGGYYIAAAADSIMANPGTITGSIGVLMKFFNYEELERWAKLKSFTLKSGPFKDMGAPDRTLGAEERQIFQDMIIEMKEQFVEDIAKGRHMKVEDVRKLADGRIYSGKEAKKLGLVDDLGNLEDAIDKAALAVGISGKPKVVYPDPPRQKLIDYILGQSVDLMLNRMVGKALVPQVTEPGTPFFLYALP